MKVRGSQGAVVGMPSLSISYNSSLQCLQYPRGIVKNILFSNFHVLGASSGPSINQNSGDNGSYTGTSLMTVSDITFRNWTGYVLGGTSQKTASITCSKTHPCSGITFEDVELRASVNGTVVGAKGTCSGVLPGGVSGMVGSGCT